MCTYVWSADGTGVNDRSHLARASSALNCCHSVAMTSLTAVRVAASSTMLLLAAKVASRAWKARLSTARG